MPQIKILSFYFSFPSSVTCRKTHRHTLDYHIPHHNHTIVEPQYNSEKRWDLKHKPKMIVFGLIKISTTLFVTKQLLGCYSSQVIGTSTIDICCP